MKVRTNCIKRFMALLLTVVMLCATSVSVFAAESPAVTDAEVLDCTVESLDDVEVSPRATARANTYLINQAGISNGNYSVRFFPPTQYDASVTLIVNLRYIDGHTGYANINVGPYSCRVPVNGTTVVVARNLSFSPVLYTFNITGVDSQLGYVVKLYDAGY